MMTMTINIPHQQTTTPTTDLHWPPPTTTTNVTTSTPQCLAPHQQIPPPPPPPLWTWWWQLPVLLLSIICTPAIIFISFSFLVWSCTNWLHTSLLLSDCLWLLCLMVCHQKIVQGSKKVALITKYLCMFLVQMECHSYLVLNCFFSLFFSPFQKLWNHIFI